MQRFDLKRFRIGRLQNEIEELKKGSAQMENPAGCANAV